MLIDSVPPASIRSTNPALTASTACTTACSPEPQTRLIGLGRHLDGHTGLDRRLPRDVHAGAGLQHAAHDHVAEVFRVDPRARDRLADDDGAEIGRGSDP